MKKMMKLTVLFIAFLAVSCGGDKGKHKELRESNKAVIEQLEKIGDKSDQQRDVDHWAYFAARESAEAFLAEAEKSGFVGYVSDPQEGEEDFSVHLARKDDVLPASVDKYTTMLADLAGKNGGEYDGWGCMPVTE